MTVEGDDERGGGERPAAEARGAGAASPAREPAGGAEGGAEGSAPVVPLRRAPSFLYRLGEDGATEGLVCDDAVGGIAKALREGTLDVAVEPSAAAAAPAGDAPQPPCEELQAGEGAHQKRGRPVGTDRDARERAVRRRSVDEPQEADEAPPSGKTGGVSEACVDPLQGVRLERPPTPPCADGHGYPSFDIVVGCAAEQGHRPYMEDRHAVDTHFVIDDSETDAQVVAGAGTSCDGVQRSYMAVYDGHNGTRAAEYAAEHMHEMFIGNDGLAGTEPGPVPPGADEPVTMAGELKMPLLAHSTPVNDSVAVAMRRAFLRLDADILRETSSMGTRDGATALVVLRWGDWLYTANAGDCRAVLVRLPPGNGDGNCGQASAMRLTTDHKPDLPNEKARVEAVGGSVEHLGCWRVRHTSLPVAVACSRTLGDLDFKHPLPLLTADPEVRRVRLDKARGDAIILIASDGLFDVLCDATAAAVAIRELLNARKMAGTIGPDGTGAGCDRAVDERAAQMAARALVRGAIACGSTDNVTAVVGVLRW